MVNRKEKKTMRVAHVFSREGNGKNIKLYADVMLADDGGDGIITVKGWKLMETNGDLWVAAPSQAGKDGKFYPQANFVYAKDGENNELTDASQVLRDKIQAALVKEYKKQNGPPAQKKDSTPPKASSGKKSDEFGTDFGF